MAKEGTDLLEKKEGVSFNYLADRLMSHLAKGMLGMIEHPFGFTSVLSNNSMQSQ